ncbi:MAG: U32 family peptidase, partial [Rikenellaceae bacterium]|nr:U32 family peptidase [Rikenellaceae bacterium]
MRRLELLIPARNLDAGMAAVDHGADAVYIGGPGFGARSAAANPIGQIAKLVGYAHPYGVKVYAALNTLIYEEELRRVETQARELISAGVDALIIQDTALLMMGLEGVAFHASTQMTNTTAEHVRFLARAGFSRVVLERGLTLGQIEEMTAVGGIETECFIHGAICVGHSGRCYLSRSMGPRSGNRGVCGQPCRMKYDLTDGSGKVLIGGKHLLSVRDLNLSRHIGRLIDAGVTSFKVEGRLKDTEYVNNITAFYRGRMEEEIAGRCG